MLKFDEGSIFFVLLKLVEAFASLAVFVVFCGGGEPPFSPPPPMASEVCVRRPLETGQGAYLLGSRVSVIGGWIRVALPLFDRVVRSLINVVSSVFAEQAC